MEVNGLEAANGWAFSQGSNGVSHLVQSYNFPAREKLTHKCYMYRLQQAEQSKRVCDYVYCDDNVIRLHQQSEHTILEEHYVDKFHRYICISGLVC